MDAGTNETRSRDLVIDFWRGASIMLVVLHHLVFYRYRDSLEAFVTLMHTQATVFASFAATSVSLLLSIAERVGPYGVRFFFVISGYLITKLMIDEERRNSSVSLSRFYTRRVFRILPAYGLYLLAVFTVGSLGLIGREPGELTGAAGFLCNTELVTCGWSVIHTWSLAIEEQFYIVWPLAFMLIPARLRTHALLVILIGLIGLSSTGMLITHGWIDNALAFACIATGALYATSEKARSLISRHGLRIGLGIILIVGCLVLLNVDLARSAFYAMLPALLLLSIMLTYRLKGITITKPFSLIAKLGLVSYSLYLWQQLFLGPPEFYLVPSFLSMPLFVVPVALASYFFIEKPAIRWCKNRMNTRS